jgi:hypothetical protein
MLPGREWRGFSLVVGAHFAVLAVVFGERLFRWLGVAIGA